MDIKCKFTAESVKRDTYGEHVQFRAVDKTGNADDVSFAEATPSGNADFYISNKAVHGHFQPGKKYIFTITEAE